MPTLNLKNPRGLQAELVCFKIKEQSTPLNSVLMEKKPKLLTKLALLLFLCMGTLLLYFWINIDDLRSEQSNRQMWHLNHKFDKK